MQQGIATFGWVGDSFRAASFVHFIWGVPRLCRWAYISTARARCSARVR